MSRQIIKQPDGRYAEWSTIVDDFVVYDATVEEMIEERVADARKDIERRVRQIVAELDAGEKPYHQFQMTLEEACRMHGAWRPDEPSGAVEEFKRRGWVP